MTYMTNQQIFDKVVVHLYNQKYPCMGEKSCAYRGHLDGHPDVAGSCAVGCLIPDSAYLPEFEKGVGGATDIGTMVTHHPFKRALLAGGVDPSDMLTVDLLRRLQYTHDSMNEYCVETVQNLCEIASEFNLDPSAIVNVEAKDANDN